MRDRYLPAELPHHRKNSRNCAAGASRRKRRSAQVQAAGGVVLADQKECSSARFLRAAWLSAAGDRQQRLALGTRSEEFYSALSGLDYVEFGDRDYIRRKELTAGTLNQVRNIASDIFGIPAHQITAESSPQTIENWDSMQHLNLVLAVEEKFGVQFDPEEIERMKNVGAVVTLVEKLQ